MARTVNQGMEWKSAITRRVMYKYTIFLSHEASPTWFTDKRKTENPVGGVLRLEKIRAINISILIREFGLYDCAKI